MKISLNWIKDYIDLPDDIFPEQLAHDLTMSTVEVEEVVRLDTYLSKIVIGKVIEFIKHENADKLFVVKCDVGEEVLQIVCGGNNLKEGMNVAVALPGSKVRWHGKDDLVDIVVSKLRGIESHGMICSASELCLSDLFSDEIEGEILDLSSFINPLGISISEVLGLDDVILDIDNKSLTNRPDLFSHYGIARELSAIYSIHLKPILSDNIPFSSLSLNQGKLDTNILADECYRLTLLSIDGVSSKKSPFWIQRRLFSIGLKPLTFLVDLSNYVMFSVGQPCHVYDADIVRGDISVRFAKDGEKISLLSGSNLHLTKSSLVVADDVAPLSLAGVMGNVKSSVTTSTQNIHVEFACFSPQVIRYATSQYDIRSDSSTRHEKAISPEFIENAVSLFLNLLKNEIKSVVISGLTDKYIRKLDKTMIRVSHDFLYRRLGLKLPTDKILRYLDALGFSVNKDEGDFLVEVPYWRNTGDVSLREDIVEEVARMHGYENFPFTPPRVSLSEPINQFSNVGLERRIKEYLSIRCGLNEVVNYPWIEDKYNYLHLTNEYLPVYLKSSSQSQQSKVLQVSLIPQILKNIKENIKYKKHFKIFELSRVFHKEGKKLNTYTVDQPKYLTVAFVGSDPKKLFLEAKGVIQYLSEYVHVEPLATKNIETNIAWIDNNVSLQILDHTKKGIGYIGLLPASIMRKLKIKKAYIILFEINISSIRSLFTRTNMYRKKIEYPEIFQDISIIIDKKVFWSDISLLIAEVDSDILRDVKFMDEYHGEEIPQNKKSLTLRLHFASSLGTLETKDVTKVVDAILLLLELKFQAIVRGT